MNVLLFVMSMLMIFTLLTYARLDSYRAQSGLQGEFVRYMETLERVYINDEADEAYKRLIVNPQSPKSGPKVTRSRSSGRLNWTPILYGETDKPGYIQTYELSKRLVDVLYKDNAQVQQMILKRPAFFDEIIGQLQHIVPSLKDQYKLKKIEDLGNLQIGDGLEVIFYYMLKGCPLSEESSPPEPITETVDEGEGGDEEDDIMLGEGQTSLLRYIGLRKQSEINVYIAPKELLTAIYGSREVVENLLDMRFDFYNAVKKKTLTSEQASEEFKKHFPSASFEGLLEFKVTTTNPRDYE